MISKRVTTWQKACGAGSEPGEERTACQWKPTGCGQVQTGSTQTKSAEEDAERKTLAKAEEGGIMS